MLCKVIYGLIAHGIRTVHRIVRARRDVAAMALHHPLNAMSY
jgi:hypothetical protein